LSHAQRLAPKRTACASTTSWHCAETQEVLVEELVAAVVALQRYAASETLSRILGSLPAAVSRSVVGALGPWRPLLLPLPTPLELLSRCSAANANCGHSLAAINGSAFSSRLLSFTGRGTMCMQSGEYKNCVASNQEEVWGSA
jgi:hypothetical protein